MLTSIGRVLSLKIKEFGLEKAIEFKKVQNDWDLIIQASIGKVFQNKSKPVKFKDGFLVVACLNSIWASEFQFKESVILDELNRKNKKINVCKIRFIS